MNLVRNNVKVIVDEFENQNDENPVYLIELRIIIHKEEAGEDIFENILAHSTDLVYSVVEKCIENKLLSPDLDVNNLEVKNSLGQVLDMTDSLAGANVSPVDILYIDKKILSNEEDGITTITTIMDVKRRPGFFWVMAAYSCLTISLALLATSVSLWLLNCPPPDQYLILLDAGSVHTAVYTYRYSYPTEPGTPISVVESHFCELGGDGDISTVGISSFKEEPSRAAHFVTNHSCVQESLSAIPAVSRKVSSMLLGSTAGMRVLRLAQPHLADQILGNLTIALQTAAGHFGLRAEARILSGLEEAQDGWVTSNYLTNSLSGYDNLTLGSLDWGGASSQITTSVARLQPNLPTLRLNGSDYHLSARSDLCYGQSEALGRHRALLVHKLYHSHNQSLPNNKTLLFTDPCLSPKTIIFVTFTQLFSSPCNLVNDSKFMDTVTDSTKDDQFVTFSAPENQTNKTNTCQLLVEEAFHYSICQARYIQPESESVCMDPESIPAPVTNQTYLAMSTYWYLTKSLGLSSPISKEEFAKVKTDICTTDFSILEKRLGRWTAEMACFQSSFMYSLLVNGYHFNTSRSWSKIQFVKNLNGAEVGWTLGHAITNDNSTTPVGIQYISPTSFMVLLATAGITSIFAILLAYQGRIVRKNEDPSNYSSLP